MQTAVLLALIQVATPTQFQRVYEKPINDRYTLSVTAADRTEEAEVRVAVRERGSKESHLIASIIDKGLLSYAVIRADDSSVVIQRSNTYSPERRVKLFYDPARSTLLKRVDYAPDVGLTAIADSEATRVLAAPLGVLQQLKQPRLETKMGDPDASYLPKPLQDHPMPQSTWDQFARARLDEVKNGFTRESTTLEEKPGPFQMVGPRIWFGKVFYDGEGMTGVGGLGYFDTGTSTYTLLPVPLMAQWSATALLIENDVAWIGLAGQPEGEIYSGGLLRYDLKSGAARKFPVEEVIDQIVPWNDRLYLGTTNGAYRLQGDRLTDRYRIEPNRDNRFIILPEKLTAPPR